ncbi:MAG: RNA methyltransferase [Pseudomonadota bacterium]|nr:RNA methyltransferase [Pseudomonadota bacterium]
MLQNINIILVETSHPGNIGSTARAMKVMGLTNLVLVNPKKFPSDESNSLAVGCKDILKNAKVTNKLSNALKSSQINIGFTSRKRKANFPILSIDECTDLILKNKNKKISALFGNEQSGLSNTELLMCNYLVLIPTFRDYKSLNLSAAVQIFAYELFKKSISGSKSVNKLDKLATTKEKNYFFEQFFNLLTKTKFITQKNIKSLTRKIHILFNKARLDSNEINILLGIISSINKKIK